MNLGTIVAFEIRRAVKHPVYLFIQLILPLLLIFILGTALDSVFTVKDEKLETVRVALVRQDEGEMGAMLDEWLRLPAVSDRIRVEPAASRSEAISRLRDGTADFALVVPADFSASVLRGGSAKWELIAGGDSGKNLAASVIFQSMLDRLNDRQAVSLALGPGLPAGQPAMQAATPDAGSSAGSFVKIGQLAAGKPYSAMQYYAASMLIMFLLYAGMFTGIGLAEEKERHTLARLHSTPVRPWHILTGKLMANFLLAVLQAVLIIGFTSAVMGVDWGTSIGLVAVACLAVILFSIGLAVLVLSFTKGSGPMNVVFQLVIGVMTFFSGGFFQLPEGMLSRIGEFTVSHWAFQSILNSMLGRTDWQPVAVVGAIAAVFLAGSFAVYRKAGYYE